MLSTTEDPVRGWTEWRRDATPGEADPEPSARLLCFALFAGLAWGMAEASYFFIVPDVLITALALRSGHAAIVALAGSVVGALIGGAVMFHWAHSDPVSALAAVDAVPFIPGRQFELAQHLTDSVGGLGILLGSFSGVPYKIFAVQAPEHMSLPVFLAWTLPGRAARFVIAAAMAAWCARRLRPRWRWRGLIGGWAVVWIAVYSGYWIEMSR